MIIGLVGAGIGGTTLAIFNDTETSQANEFTAGELDLRVDWEESYNGEQIDTQELTNDPGSIFNFEDLKPGDHGEATISLHLEDNPGWIWMNLNQTSNWDNACTEPEHEAEPGNCGSEGELDEELEFVIWADDGDNVLQDGENVLFEGTAEELEEQSTLEGLLLDGNTSTSEPDPFSGEETGYIGVKWNLPLDTGNHIQGDSVSYDVSFYTEQSRNNENPENPWGSENETEPENEPPVASFERANERNFSTTVGNEVRLFSTSTDDDEIVKNVWNMGDGTTKFGIDVRHAWNESGNYTVSLEVTDSDGETDTASRVMEVTGEPIDDSCQEPTDPSKEYTADMISQAKYGYDFEDLSDETRCEVVDLFNNQPFADGLMPEDVMTKDELSQDMFDRDYSELSSDSKADVDEAYMNQFADEEEPSPPGNLTFNDQMVTEDGEVVINNVSTTVGSTVYVTYQDGNDTVIAGIHNAPANLDNFDPMTVEINQSGVPGEHTARMMEKPIAIGYDVGDVLQESTLEKQYFSQSAQISERDIEYTAEQDGETIYLDPIQGDQTPQELYDFRLPERFNNPADNNASNGATYGGGSYYGSVGTEDLQEADTSIMFLYEGPEGISLVVVHEGQGSQDGGAATFEVTDLEGGEWVVKDDLYLRPNGNKASSNYDIWNTDTNPQTIDWTWGSGGSDGGVYSPLTETFSFTISPSFNEEAELYNEFYQGEVDEWQVLSGDRNNPNRTSLNMDEDVVISAN